MVPEQRGGTVHVVDDDAAVRDSLTALLTSVGLTVQASATPEDFLAKYESVCPECVILDLRMPGMSGLEVYERLKKRVEGIPVLFVTGHGEVGAAVQAMKSGALDFLEKPYSHQQLLDRVYEALQQDELRKTSDGNRRDIQKRVATLTGREQTILGMVIEGLSSKMIASDLDISLKTVEAHRTSIMQKMQAKNAADLVRLALTAGLDPSGKGAAKMSGD